MAIHFSSTVVEKKKCNIKVTGASFIQAPISRQKCVRNYYDNIRHAV